MILTLDQLKRRSFSLASRCPFCKRAEEVMEHILLRCPMISGLWTTLFSLQDGGWVCPYSIQELFLDWKILEGQKIVEDGGALPLWAIWKERNIIVFEDEQFSLDRLKSSRTQFLG